MRQGKTEKCKIIPQAHRLVVFLRRKLNASLERNSPLPSILALVIVSGIVGPFLPCMGECPPLTPTSIQEPY